MSVPIKREDIKAGDRIRQSREYTAERDGETLGVHACTYELVERPAPLPTALGFYLDNEGNVWYRQSTGANAGSHWQDAAGERYTDDVARNFAPLTLVRPVAEVVAEVIADVELAARAYTSGTNRTVKHVDDGLVTALEYVATKYGVTL